MNPEDQGSSAPGAFDGDISATDHRMLLRSVNEGSWGAFLIGIALKTAAVLMAGGVVFFVLALVRK